MSIRRSPSALRKNFTVLSNATLADARLSWEARGLLAYLISKPDHWVINIKHLAKESPSASKQRLYRILNELENCGYLTQERVRDEKGRLGETERIVHEIVPNDDLSTGGFSTSGFSTSGFSTSGKSGDIVRTEEIVRTEDLERTENSSAPSSDGSDSNEVVASEIVSPVVAKARLNPDVTRLCHLLADLLVENGCRTPKVNDAWFSDMDKLIRIDKQPAEEVEHIIRWTQAHDFWRTNIMSPSKLRKQYDRLRLQAIADFRKTTPKATTGIQEFLEVMGK